jgi:hypothetical protein
VTGTLQHGASRKPSNFRSTLFGITVGITASVALLSVLGVSPAFAANDCKAPDMPSLPDGSSASMEDMLAGQKAVKAFQAGNMEYMQCLEAIYTAAEETAKSAGDSASREAAEAQYTESIEAYNAAVSAEEEVAGAFNIALRAFKAASR